MEKRVREKEKKGERIREREREMEKEKVCDSYCISDCFSENTRTQKSAFLCGSKVEGTMRYSPGGSLKRVLTSLRLMKVSERAF